MPPPKSVNAEALWASPLISRVLELTVTAWDLQPFANDCNYDGPPFRWDEERRFQLRCELDALFFHLYLPAEGDGSWKPARIADGSVRDETDVELATLQSHFPTPRDAVSYIMDTFPIVRKKDEKAHGSYRTKDRILELYDQMLEAQRDGHEWQSPLEPPPADPSCRHPKCKTGILAFGSLIHDPGPEIFEKTQFILETETPFDVEYCRLSQKRGDAPTLAPHSKGSKVKAKIIILDDSVTEQEAQDLLYRRETRQIRTGETFTPSNDPNRVKAKVHHDHPCVDSLIYTDFNDGGKIPDPDSATLAKAAIESVAKADPGQDGITYLINAIAAGIQTPLTEAYKEEILEQMKSDSLEEAMKRLSRNHES